MAASLPTPRVVALVDICLMDDPEGLRSLSWSNSGHYDAFPSHRAVLDREGRGLCSIATARCSRAVPVGGWARGLDEGLLDDESDV